MKTINQTVFEKIYNSLPFGLMIVDKALTIKSWNAWLKDNTQIPEEQAIGKSLNSIFGESYFSSRFNWALEQVLNYSHPQILSSMLNEYLVPVSIVKGPFGELDKMQQEVYILPIDDDDNMALIIIKDVTQRVHLKNTLMAIAAKFEQSSFVDMLTGCYNRRFLYKYLDAELSNAIRGGYNIFCFMFDIDFFKKINDELGHDAGDEVLKSFAKIVRSLIRPNDYFFRYGGEEFISISSRLNIQDAITIAQRILRELEGTKKHGSVKKQLTCSCGISYWTTAYPLISGEELISLADIELYKAKSRGRNCISIDDRIV
ncbi:sensor histidine kinase [Legionella busanensis]|uniref:diguanylate cyclase n=1 Tax=Legionella busanensis TaxID=190655 RepID=A0A378JPA7_9GAMM|nr:GGDEF domain-containing protein [Legionella busanensis]STX49962.1 sensor histidine kinase [Legionella busanensis]